MLVERTGVRHAPEHQPVSRATSPPAPARLPVVETQASGGGKPTDALARTLARAVELRGSADTSAPSDAVVRQRASAPVVARKVKKSKINAPTAAETAILQAIDAYNLLSTGKTPAKLAARFNALQAIDRQIYAWFGATPTVDLMTLPHAVPMRDMLHASEIERAKVVERLRHLKGGPTLPVSGLVAGEDVHAIAALWTSVSGGAGGLQVAGGSSAQRAIYGRLAALMQTPSGRRFLAYLDTQTAGDITIAFRDKKTLDKLDPTKTLSKQGGSFAAPMTAGVVGVPTPMTTSAGPPGALTPTAASLVDELMQPIAAGGAASFGIQGQSYARQAGTGSVTVISPDPVLDPNRFKQSSATGHEVLTPTHITLMHELGHSLKMAAGGYLPAALGTGGPPPAALGIIPVNEREMWQASKNAAAIEEYVNVQAIENPVRTESGVGTREYYETPEIVQIELRRAPHMANWQQILTSDPEAQVYLDEAFMRCQTAQPVADATLFTARSPAEVDTRVAPILADLALAGNPAALLARKVAYLQGKLVAAMSAYDFTDQGHLRGTDEYQDVVDDYASAASAAALPIQPTRDLIARLPSLLASAKVAV